MKTFLLFISYVLVFTSLNGQDYKISITESEYFDPIKNGELRQDVSDGDYHIYYDTLKNKIYYEGKIINQNREGKWRWYSEDGILQREMNYHDNKLNGIAISYFPDGNQSMTISFLDNNKEGPMRRYYPNGNTRLLGQYSNDAPTGIWQFFGEDGTILKEEHY